VKGAMDHAPAIGPPALKPSALNNGTVAAAGVRSTTPFTTWKKVW
jgi:hypothetical protein